MLRLNLDSFRRALKSETTLGLLTRVGLFATLMFAVLGIALLVLAMTPMLAVKVRELFTVFLVATLPLAASIVVGERPLGDDWIPVRMGLAAFCRTGLPLFCVVVITLVSKNQPQPLLLGCLVFFYILGILAAVWISVYRLSGSNVDSDKKR